MGVRNQLFSFADMDISETQVTHGGLQHEGVASQTTGTLQVVSGRSYIRLVGGPALLDSEWTSVCCCLALYILDRLSLSV
jgi:hypothetical protein